ncbi:MAG: aminoacyl-histidine dipeptidase [Bacteroidetes bacterium]|nr:aminoacyl-histidine dipeptidase [Bacteroidota bacterium]
MSSAIEGLKPALLWKYFAEIAMIPRCSKHEGAMVKYVMETAKRLGLEAKADKFGNVVVRKPASPGKESTSSVVLQGHLDMVCEKNKDTVHDFSKDPIELVRKGNVLMANGTTLGADNGVAVATNLAIMEDRSLQHGPLEFLFTVDEETGLTGASNLGSDFLVSKTLLNLDSEEEGAVYVGCSGGKNTLASWKLALDAAPAGTLAAEVKVGGLKGGHSGLEIDKNRGNSIKILARVLTALADMGTRIASIEGGNKHNAIPREAEALVFVPKKKWDAAAKLVADWQAIIRAELGKVDPDLVIALEPKKGKKAKVMKKAMAAKLLQTLAALPHGVIKMSSDIPGLVETSTNVATIKTTKKTVEMATSQRSSVASEIMEICSTVKSIFGLGGAAVKQTDGYPGWKPNMDSPVLKVAKDTYRSLYGKEPLVKAIHAGLECGIIGERYPGMDMLSFGPTLEGVHSPDEKIYIDTVEKFWDYLLGILKNVR